MALYVIFLSRLLPMKFFCYVIWINLWNALVLLCFGLWNHRKCMPEHSDFWYSLHFDFVILVLLAKSFVTMSRKKIEMFLAALLFILGSNLGIIKRMFEVAELKWVQIINAASFLTCISKLVLS